MDRLQACIIDLRKLSSERENDMRHLRLNHKIDQAQEAAKEMDDINIAIHFLGQYQTMLNAFRVIKAHLILDKRE